LEVSRGGSRRFECNCCRAIRIGDRKVNSCKLSHDLPEQSVSGLECL
jgi:hypothetical protein